MAKLLSRRTFIIGGIGSLAYLYWQYKSITIKHYTISILDLPREFQGFTILHLSDLHSKEYGENQRHLLKLMEEINFDLIALTGDFVDKRTPKKGPLISLIKGNGDKPTFFVPGNHEWGTGFSVKEELEALGVKVLDNKGYRFTKGESHIWILGVDDPYLGRDDLEGAMREIQDDSPKVLLAHAPNIFGRAIEKNIDLTLVGHTHGGQIRLPFVGAIVVPGQGLFPKYDYGLYTSGGSSMIINGGVGESVLPLRFNLRPEIVVIKLVKKV